MNPTRTLWTVLILMAAVIVSSGYIISSQWHYPLATLFAVSGDLPLVQLATQLQILPTMMVAMLAGGLLTVSSLLLQQIVGNTLASDSTFAVGSGSQMLMVLVVLFLPNIGLYGSFWVAFIGAIGSMALVFLLSARAKFETTALILSGLIVNILLYALVNLLMVFYSEATLGVMIWGAGTLVQTSWQNTVFLSLMTIALGLCLVPLIRPLTLLSLDDTTAKSLGLPTKHLRILVAIISALIVAGVVSRLGVLAFSGLAGATLVNALGVRHTATRLWAGFVLGGALLWLTSNLTTIISHLSAFSLSAGAMTGILGAPIILYLILNQKKHTIEEETTLPMPTPKSVHFPLFAISLIILFGLVLIFTKNATGFGFSLDSTLIQSFRLPRTLGAMSAGAMLAIAGVLLQNLTKNPIASPEVLGVSSGGALGVIATFMLLPVFGIAHHNAWLLVGGVLGSLMVLALILSLAKRLGSGELLLVGVAISALMTGVLTLIRLSGDPRLQAMLSWLSGTTYHLTLSTAVALGVLSMLSLISALMLVKPLRLLSLGATVALGRGVAVGRYQMLLLALIAMLSAFATLAVGPLSFVGLMIPHLAAALGATSPAKQLSLSALLGAMGLLIADWLGRYMIFPYEIPAGTLMAILGAGYFMYLMRNNSSI